MTAKEQWLLQYRETTVARELYVRNTKPSPRPHHGQLFHHPALIVSGVSDALLQQPAQQLSGTILLQGC
jgi:hypothetical protein